MTDPRQPNPLRNGVDVRDYGACGDGMTDDTDAFRAADAAANGRHVLALPPNGPGKCETQGETR